MAVQKAVSTELIIKVNGTKIEPSVRNQIAEVIVDQHVLIPSMFTIRLYDPSLELLDSGPFDLTKEIIIEAGTGKRDINHLIKGEVTAIEPSFGEGMVSEVVVRGYDISHRMYRETKSRAFLNQKDSDVAQTIAGDHGLSPDIESTSPVYDHIFQDNQTDLQFLMARAWRIGFECFVEDSTLYFRKPKVQSPETDLTWGEGLISFHPRMTLAEQVDEVIVKGWDPKKQSPIVGNSTSGKLYSNIKERKDGASWAGSFGTGKKIIVDQPVISQSEAKKLAGARLDELSGAFVQGEGVAARRPDLKAGKTIELKSLGKRFSGKYLVTQLKHVYSPEGFHTYFNVRGNRNGLLIDDLGEREKRVRYPSVVVAKVKDTDDPEGWGRIKVVYPWMSEEAVSTWARLIGPGGGPDCGLFAVPDVDDEVLVAFGHGDFSEPYVLGGLWNGEFNPPPDGADAPSNEKPKVHTWYSRGGHSITFHDIDKKIVVASTDGSTISIMDDGSDEIEIKGKGDSVITLGGSKIKMETSQGAVVELSGRNIKLEGDTIDITGNTTVNISGTMTTNIDGGMVNINS